MISRATIATPARTARVNRIVLRLMLPSKRIMFIMFTKRAIAGAGVPCIILGIFAGLGIGLSALFQGRAAAAACDAQGETGQGLTNYFGALGIVETVAIFTMVFAIIAIMFIK